MLKAVRYGSFNIDIMVTQQTWGSDSGQWSGSFRVSKAGMEVAAPKSVAGLEETAAEAEQKALRIAKKHVDDNLSD